MNSTIRNTLVATVACVLTLAISASVHAQAETSVTSTGCGDGLKSFGPLGPFGYPSYYVDQSMVGLDHCDEPLSVDPLCGNPDFGQPEGLPLGPVPDVAAGNFWAETFYTRADADVVFPGGDALLVLAVEGVWNNAAEAIIDGDQLVFSRIRVRVTLPNDPSSAGTYTVTHPYGVDTFEVTAADIAATAGIRAINFTDDCLHTVVGGVITPSCAVATGDQFTNVLADLTDDTTARISHWLTWDPPSSAPPGYVGDPAIFHAVTGGSCGTNFFRVEGPGIAGGSVTSTQFLLKGRYAHFCGDGFVDANLGETCDDGNTVAGDCCSATCTTEPDGQACTDGNACTTTDSCSAGVCTGAGALVCNDASACTADACVPASGCVFTPIVCNDASACTIDTCNPASGCVFTPTVCNDASACTTDTCNPASGCVFTPIVCNDASVCTTDTCNPASGCVFTPTGCPVTPVSATVDADATVNSASPNANFGTANQVNVDAGPSVLQTYMRVSVSGLGNRTITSAKLRLKAATTSNANSNSGGRLHVTSCGWTETGLTFNNRPAFTPAVLSAVGAVALGQTVDFDVSSVVTADGTYCFAIDSLSTDGVDYNSRQATTVANRPALVLTTSCPCAPAPTCGDNVVNQPSEQCDGAANATCPNGCQANCTCTPAPPAVATATVIADATVNSASANTNLGTANQLNVDAGPDVKRTFLKIQVTGVGAQTVTQALLNLRVAGTTNAQSVSGGRIHKVTNCTWTETGITFNNQPAIDPGVLSSLGAVALNQAVSFNITGGIPGDGTFCLAIDSTSTDGVDYNSRQASTVANRPTVTLTVAP
jgi:cysteine-rich repeat protein